MTKPTAYPGYHLAQANVAYALAPIGDPLLADYVARLDEINELADGSPGFVWRYLTDSRDPAQREFHDPYVLFNMSVWESIDALHAYTYRSGHVEVYAARRRWFAEPKAVVGGHALAMWWVRPASDRPSRMRSSASHGSASMDYCRARSRSSSGSPPAMTRDALAPACAMAALDYVHLRRPAVQLGWNRT